MVFHELWTLWTISKYAQKNVKLLFSGRLELPTSRVLGERDNRYTKRTTCLDLANNCLHVKLAGRENDDFAYWIWLLTRRKRRIQKFLTEEAGGPFSVKKCE